MIQPKYSITVHNRSKLLLQTKLLLHTKIFTSSLEVIMSFRFLLRSRIPRQQYTVIKYNLDRSRVPSSVSGKPSDFRRPASGRIPRVISYFF